MDESTRAIVAALIDRFNRNRDTYRSQQYNETLLRQDFLNPLFAALGWDMDNRLGYAEAYRDVIHEDAIKVGVATKAPDYCFRVGGRRIFFLEAKRPSVAIRDAVSPAYQLRRYAWSAKLPLSILTDFEELAVYDCRIKPAPDDKPSTARILLLSYTDYLDRWDELTSTFSKDAVLKGSFDKYAETTRLKRGTTEVDAAFLEEISQWREVLARNFALRNDLDARQLNFAVQRTIDRIIFLRMCEDRGIETYQQLAAIANGTQCYKRLCELFYRADDRYNSGLFHFEPERGRAEAPDDLTPSLKLDDKPLKEILKSLYYPDCPYEFSVLPAEILGQVYEQFLGKVIRLTAGGQARIEDKPEVKKAGGVYYTPAYIVDYIVKETVGKLVEGKKPKQVEKLRILDPACGSGSFLLGAYTFLLNWHRDWYVEDGRAKHTKEVYQGRGGQWYLATAEKKRILLNNIYGVDIDSQAVEVTKLSLLLKVLEGETGETLQRQLRLDIRHRALPDLGNNIKCGNSLIGPDFYKDRQMSLLDEEEQYRINAFDWRTEFPEIFKGKDGGFDVVIGNPPYVNAWGLTDTSPLIRDYVNRSNSYVTADRHWDLYILFLEKSIRLAREAGRVSFIIPFSYAIQKYGRLSRKFFLERYQIDSIADLRRVRVFGRVPVITIIPVFVKRQPPKAHHVDVRGPGPEATKSHAGTIVSRHGILQRRFLDQYEEMLRLDLSDSAIDLCRRVEDRSVSVGEMCWVNYGAQMSSRIKAKFGKDFVLRNRKETPTCRKTVSGRNLYRYSVEWDGKYVEWALADKMYGPRDVKFFELPKLMIRDITGTHRLELTLDGSGLYCDHTILCAQRASEARTWRDFDDQAVNLSKEYSLDLLLGLLASRLVSAYYYLMLSGEGVRIGGGFHTYPKTIRALPVFNVAHARNGKLDQVAQIESLAGRLLNLHARRRETRMPQQKTVLDRRIAATDRQIDELVYELYELTDNEIRIVEEATAPGRADSVEEVAADEAGNAD
ncbi:MAG: N-6 DNA methylase [Pirellulales bacterium]